MFGKYFYHSKTVKAVAIFGRLFNDLYVVRKNSNGSSFSSVKVPLSYAPKQKFLDRIAQQANLDTDQQVAVKLPRMSFEITGIQYDASRQLQKTTNFSQVGTSTTRSKLNAYTPYLISFALNVYAKNQDDALQIVEQILPYFNPQYTVTIKPFPDDYPDVKEDIPITITGVDFSDDYEGQLESRRTIIYTMTFDLKLNYYGAIGSSSVITRSINNVYQILSPDGDTQIGTITVTPTPEGTLGDSDYGFNEDIDFESPIAPYAVSGYAVDGYTVT